MRTAIYVDGFNLYYRALKGTPYRWLDFVALSRQLLRPSNRVTLVRYFTARVMPRASKRDQHARQDSYLRALQAHIPVLKLHEGQFFRHVVRMPLANPPVCGSGTAEVIKIEEKGSDVNLAVHLLNDAWSDAFDVALVISNDSDLAEAIKLARQRSKAVGVANPHPVDRMNFSLYSASSFRRRIERKHLKNAQLPESVISGSRVISKPSNW